MGKAKTKTEANTALTIKRSSNKFSASWKIKAKKVKSQKLRYRTFNGTTWTDWSTVSVGKSATSYSFELNAANAIAQVQVQTQTLRKPTNKYKESSWSSSSCIFYLGPPPNPELTVSRDSANKTTFNWTIETSDTDAFWYYQCQYRTKCTVSPDADSGWSAWATASSSYTYTDNTLGTTRIFQLKAVGPGGESDVQTQRHVITTAPIASWNKPAVTHSTQSSYYEMTYDISLNGSSDTVDSIVPQYYIGKPAANMSCPPGATFTDGTTYNFSDGQTNYTLAITTSDLIDEDECLWARVKTTHDSVDSFSSAYRIITGVLADPSCSISMGTITAAGFTVTVNVSDAGTDVPGAYQQVFLEKRSAPGVENYILIGTIPNGTSSKAISSTINLTTEAGYAIHVRNVTADGETMKSGFYTYKTTMPAAPTLNSVEPTTVLGKVYLDWTNNWADATGVVIAWTDDPDNWMSNDDPETYEIEQIASNWYITGLETGKSWHFRVRSMREANDTITYSPWSAEMSVDLSSAPAIPVLYLSDKTVTEDGIVTAYWSYMTTDGTSQVAASIVTATFSGGAWTYGAPIKATTTAQHIDIDVKKQGWTNGTVKYLALQTRSGSGGMSDYSTPVKLVIAGKPSVTITSTSFVSSETLTEYFTGDGATTSFVCSYDLSASPTVKVDDVTKSATYSGDTVTVSAAPADGAVVAITYTTEDNSVLDDMPLSVTVTGTDAALVTLAIERAVTYPMLRPDGTETDGAVGETVYVKTEPAESSNTFSVTFDELIGRLDDGAFYNLVATVTDNYGQKADAKMLFKVHWSHQAWEPTATFETDPDNYIAKITPVAGADYVSGDTCDIYRLGIDKPELIYSEAQFGTAYVDPYPAFGEHSGYKVVTITNNKDYITEDNSFAEYDTTEEEGVYDQLDTGLMVIDFDGERVELPYNITLDNSWAKDFKRTAYLGGHVTGDHNKAVTRDLTAKTVIVPKYDSETAAVMRKLARYSGICHIRTPEGSSFAADIQVSESMAYNSATASYSLSIEKIDNIGFDGMTYTEWLELQSEESE